MPKRIQRKRTKGWRMPENAVYVGRPSKWGNPFTGTDAVKMYRIAVMANPFRNGDVFRAMWREWVKCGGDEDFLFGIANRDDYYLRNLRGKDLACWCPLDKPCHADILLEIVNEVKI